MCYFLLKLKCSYSCTYLYQQNAKQYDAGGIIIATINIHGVVGVVTFSGANVKGKMVGRIILTGVTTTTCVSGGTVSFLRPDVVLPTAVALTTAVLVTVVVVG